MPQEDLNVIIDAFEVKDVSEGLKVIAEGNEGQHLYMVKTGEYDCFKSGVLVKQYK